jgi:hypothetical protein
VGTVIEPQAEITFYANANNLNSAQPVILTNLEKTILTNTAIIDGKKCSDFTMPACKNCKIVPGPTRDTNKPRN